jgi:primosomal protein N'
VAEHHPCGTPLPDGDVGALIEHLATCPETGRELAAWTRALVSAARGDVVSTAMPRAVSRDVRATRAPSRKTPAVSRETTTEEMAAMRDAGKSLRDIAAVSGVAPETVRRRLARHAEGSES